MSRYNPDFPIHSKETALMFEAKTYQEKRAALNEILLQQLLNVVMNSPSTTDIQRKGLLGATEQYGRAQQILRDKEAAAILGDVEIPASETPATQGFILNTLIQNLGRSYFGTEEKTPAEDGAIGTPGFDHKFKDWLAGLPEYDNTLSKDIATGFYRDTMTRGPKQPLPLLVLREPGTQEITVVLYSAYVSIMTLNLAHVPADYRWDVQNHYALRGEMYTYRNSLTTHQVETLIAQALIEHTETPFKAYVPAAPAPSGDEVTPPAPEAAATSIETTDAPAA